MSHQITTTRGPITIRPAVPDDAAALRALRLEALAAQPEAFAADHAATAADPAGWWAERITKNALQDEGVICVAAAGEQLIGMAGLYRGHWPKIRHGATIWGVYVNPAWRGLRVAETLLDGCADWARARGITLVKLGVVTTNAPAIRCYTRWGLKVYGVDPKVICYDGIFYDELLMARELLP